MQFEAVLFDLGNTLLRWTCGADALRAAAAARGAHLDPRQAAQWWARLHRPVVAADLCMGDGWSAVRYAEAVRRHYAEADSLADGLSSWLHERITDPTCYEPFPGAVELLSRVRSLGLRVGVVSDTGFDVRPALDRGGLSPWIEAVVLSHEQGACKPAEVLFRRACRLLGVAPAATIMVGDNPAADGGAVATGLTALLLPALPDGEDRDLDAVLGLLRACW